MSEEEKDEGGKKALMFDDLEDIPSIDCEESVSESLPKSKVNERKETEGEIKTDDEKKRGPSNGDKTEDKEDKPMAPDKATCLDDKGGEQALDDNGVTPVTHTFSFALRTEEGETKPMDPPAVTKVSKAKKPKKLKSTKLLKDERDSDSSVSSKKKGTKGKMQVKCKFAAGGMEYIEDCLQGRFFSGWVEERKWVEHLGGYRDVVEVDEWEADLNKQLNTIIRSIPGVLEGNKWINITPPSFNDTCYCLWVLLGEAPTPGHYWFTITGVSVQPQFGLRISLRILRSIHPQDYETADVRQKRKNQLQSFEPGQELETISQQFVDWWDQAKQMNFAMVWSAITTTLTLSNIREAIRFMVVLVITLTVGLVSFLRGSHHLVLRFIREAGIFFHNITPFLQTVMSFVEKLIGGFYLLIAMVYRDIRQPSGPPPQNFQTPRQAPLALGPGQSPQSPYAAGPRVVKYVPPEHWVYKSQNNSSPPS